MNQTMRLPRLPSKVRSLSSCTRQRGTSTRQSLRAQTETSFCNCWPHNGPKGCLLLLLCLLFTDHWVLECLLQGSATCCCCCCCNGGRECGGAGSRSATTITTFTETIQSTKYSDRCLGPSVVRSLGPSVPCDPMPSHLISSYRIPPHPIHPIPSHPTQFHPPHPVPSHP